MAACVDAEAPLVIRPPPLLGARLASAMKDFAFKVNLVAVVRVRADDESVARKIGPTVLGAPGTLETDWRTMLRVAITQR